MFHHISEHFEFQSKLYSSLLFFTFSHSMKLFLSITASRSSPLRVRRWTAPEKIWRFICPRVRGRFPLASRSTGHEQRRPVCNTAAKRMRMRQFWHFRFAQFLLVSCLFSRKFYKVCNKQLSLLLQQKSLKEYAFRFLNFISFSGKEIPNSLQQCKACEPACQL